LSQKTCAFKSGVFFDKRVPSCFEPGHLSVVV